MIQWIHLLAIHCLVCSVVAVLHWPRVWTQVLYAVLEWIFNYQNNGGRHGTGKLTSFWELLCIGDEGERKGGILCSLKWQKPPKWNKNPNKIMKESFGGCSLCHWWSWRELRGVSAGICSGWEESCCAQWHIWDAMIEPVCYFCCGFEWNLLPWNSWWCKNRINWFFCDLLCDVFFFPDHFMPCSWLWYLSWWQYSYVSMMSCCLLAFLSVSILLFMCYSNVLTWDKTCIKVAERLVMTCLLPACLLASVQLKAHAMVLGEKTPWPVWSAWQQNKHQADFPNPV